MRLDGSTSTISGGGLAELCDNRHSGEGPEAIQAGIDNPTTRHLPPRSEHFDLHLGHRILGCLCVLVKGGNEQLSHMGHVDTRNIRGDSRGIGLRRKSRG